MRAYSIFSKSLVEVKLFVIILLSSSLDSHFAHNLKPQFDAKVVSNNLINGAFEMLYLLLGTDKVGGEW